MKLVYIADNIKKNEEFDILSRQLEQESHENTKLMFNEIRKIDSKALLYTTLDKFTNDIESLKDHVVFINFFGKSSRNRRSLLPGICEANNIRYVGADVYANTISLDKHISKLYCNDFGMKTPKSVIYNLDFEFRHIEHLELPLIVKPNFEGSSCGISKSNLLKTYKDTLEKAKEIYTSGFDSVIIEEYIKGEEVEVFMFGNNRSIHIKYESQIKYCKSNVEENRVFDAITKMKDESYLEVDSSLTSAEDIKIMEEIFFSFKKVEFMRFDGIIKDGRFHLIELSPDCGISIDSNVARAFQKENIEFTDGLKLMIINSLMPDQIPNILKSLDQIDDFFR